MNRTETVHIHFPKAMYKRAWTEVSETKETDGREKRKREGIEGRDGGARTHSVGLALLGVLLPQLWECEHEQIP